MKMNCKNCGGEILYSGQRCSRCHHFTANAAYEPGLDLFNRMFNNSNIVETDSSYINNNYSYNSDTSSSFDGFSGGDSGGGGSSNDW